MYPYFTAALLFSKAEKLYRDKYTGRSPLRAFRWHILLAFRELVAGRPPNLIEGKAAKDFCEKLLGVICDEGSFGNHIVESLRAFEDARQEWVGPMKKSADGIRDVPDFTQVLLAKCAVESREVSTEAMGALELQEDEYVGRVVKVFLDRYNTQAGFIGRRPHDVFFHSSDSEGLDFSELDGKLVSYKFGKRPDGREKATQVRLID